VAGTLNRIGESSLRIRRQLRTNPRIEFYQTGDKCDPSAATQDIPPGNYLLPLVTLVRLLNTISVKTFDGT
jgi:hypothetical protein